MQQNNSDQDTLDRDKPLEKPEFDPLDLVGGVGTGLERAAMLGRSSFTGLAGLLARSGGREALEAAAPSMERMAAKVAAPSVERMAAQVAAPAVDSTFAAAAKSAPLSQIESSLGKGNVHNNILNVGEEGEHYLTDKQGSPIARFIDGQLHSFDTPADQARQMNFEKLRGVLSGNAQ